MANDDVIIPANILRSIVPAPLGRLTSTEFSINQKDVIEFVRDVCGLCEAKDATMHLAVGIVRLANLVHFYRVRAIAVGLTGIEADSLAAAERSIRELVLMLPGDWHLLLMAGDPREASVIRIAREKDGPAIVVPCHRYT